MDMTALKYEPPMAEHQCADNVLPILEESKDRVHSPSSIDSLTISQQPLNTTYCMNIDASTPTNASPPLHSNICINGMHDGPSDKNRYEEKIQSLENELKGIRHLLEDTKSKRSESTGKQLVPDTIDVPAHQHNPAIDSPATHGLSTISSKRAHSRQETRTLQFRAKLSYVGSSRRDSGNQFVPDAFSPASSWCDESSSFVPTRRHSSCQLLQPKPKPSLLRNMS